MSKMNELSIDHEAYEQYVESLNQDLRREGAEELRKEILRLIEHQRSSVTANPSVELGLALATDLVNRASI